MRYKVKLIFQYSDIIHVEADSKEEAIKVALNSKFEEEYECFYDAEVNEITTEFMSYYPRGIITI